MDSRLFSVAAIIGFVAMLAGFIGYVMDPRDAFVTLFVIGLVLLVAGYVVLYIVNNRAWQEVASVESAEEEEGYFYILDEDYVGESDEATIEYLERRCRCQPSTPTSSTCSSTRPTSTAGTTT